MKRSKSKKTPITNKKYESDDEDSLDRAAFNKENNFGDGFHLINIDAIDEMEGVVPGTDHLDHYGTSAPFEKVATEGR